MRFLYFMIIAVSVLLTSCGQGVNTSGTASEKKVHPWLVYEEGVTFDDIYLVKDMIGSLSIFGEPPRSFLDECHRHNIEVYKAVAGKTESIDTQEERDALYESYVNYCENGYDGIDFDFEGIDAGMQEVYSEFLKKTASRLHQMGKKVSHCVGFYPNMYEDENALMFYDPEVLNEVCDLVRIMCYDMYWAPGNAGGDAPSYFGPTSHYAWAKLAVEHWMKKISHDKLVMALPAYGNDYVLEKGLKGSQVYSPVPVDVKGKLPEPSWLYYEKLNLYIYDNTDGKRHMFYASDGKSTDALLDLAGEMGINKIGFWNFNSVSSGMWDEVRKWYNEGNPDIEEWTTDEEMPILSWYSVPLVSSSPEAFKEVRDCGYTHSLSTVWGNEDSVANYNSDLLAKALDDAHSVGLKVIGGCYELTKKDPTETVNKLKDHPALVGWHLMDEPKIGQIKQLGEIGRKIKELDDENFIYVNLRPADATYEQMGTDSYTEYINEYIQEIPVDFVSFDKYPCQIAEDGSLYVLDFWYDNLQQIYDLAKSVGKDFWAFASGVKFESVQAQPSLATLRLQMFTNLAYGAQGLQYFVFQNSTSPTYNMVRQVNQEIQNYAKVFLDAELVSVTHTGSGIPVRTKPFLKAPEQIRHFSTGDAGAVVSVLKKGNRNFFVVVSRDLNNDLPVTIEPEKMLWKVTKNGTVVKVRGRVEEMLSPGDMLVYMWED